MRFKNKKFQTRLFLCSCLFVSFLVACSNVDTKNQKSENNRPNKVAQHAGNVSERGLITLHQAENFTTSGKLTKRRDTPNGPVEIYDIAQDEEVTLAIKDLYEQGHLTFGDVTHRYGTWDLENFFSPDLEITPAALLLAKARQIAYYDLFRTSCQKVERSPCGLGNSSMRAVYFTEHPECKNCNLGKPPTSEALVGHYGRTAALFLAEDVLGKGRWPSSITGAGAKVIINECRDNVSKQVLLPYFYIGEKSGYSLEETQKILRHHVCNDE